MNTIMHAPHAHVHECSVYTLHTDTVGLYFFIPFAELWVLTEYMKANVIQPEKNIFMHGPEAHKNHFPFRFLLCGEFPLSSEIHS